MCSSDLLSCPFPSLPIPSHPFLARPVPSHAVPSCPLSFRKMDLIDNSFFDKQFKPRLEDKFLKIEHPLPDVEAIQAKSWVEVLAETDESLQKRSSSNRSIRRRARYFARKVYSKSAELFLLCSLSYSIYGLPKIPPGPFYKQLEEWWASCPPQKPLALATETICRDLPPHDDKSENSPTSASVKKSIELPPEATSRQFLPTRHEGRPIGLNGNQEQNQTEPDRQGEETTFDERPSKLPRLEPQALENPNLFGEGPYFSFSFMRRHMIDKLPEPFRTGMQTSKLWRDEQERGGLSVTNCLSI